jgi:small subunit ribosomal protein S16
VGTYRPREEPSGLDIDNDKALKWLRDGAQPTDRVQTLLKISGAWEQFEASRPNKTKGAKAE